MNEAALLINKAPLPVVYRDACQALAECEQLDECKSWSDRALALASYARQAKDTTLLVTAQRIQIRAVARLGELLGEIEPDKGGRPKTEAAAYPSLRQAAVEEVGLSEHQAKQALRVANVPATEREQLIESETPPTVTQLAELGTKHKPPRAIDLLAGPWADWVFGIAHLSKLPACSLEALIERRELSSGLLLTEAMAALINLERWIELLKEDVDADCQRTDR